VDIVSLTISMISLRVEITGRYKKYVRNKCNPCLPSLWWLLIELHLVIHPSYHTLHPYRQLPIELIILKLLRLISCSSLICFSWICHSDWQEQIVVDATDAEEPNVVGLDAIEPDAEL